MDLRPMLHALSVGDTVDLLKEWVPFDESRAGHYVVESKDKPEHAWQTVLMLRRDDGRLLRLVVEPLDGTD